MSHRRLALRGANKQDCRVRHYARLPSPGLPACEQYEKTSTKIGGTRTCRTRPMLGWWHPKISKYAQPDARCRQRIRGSNNTASLLVGCGTNPRHESLAHGQRKAPQTRSESRDARRAHDQPYILICTGGMAPTCHWAVPPANFPQRGPIVPYGPCCLAPTSDGLTSLPVAVSPGCALRLFPSALTDFVAEVRNLVVDFGPRFFTAGRCD